MLCWLASLLVVLSAVDDRIYPLSSTPVRRCTQRSNRSACLSTESTTHTAPTPYTTVCLDWTATVRQPIYLPTDRQTDRQRYASLKEDGKHGNRGTTAAYMRSSIFFATTMTVLQRI